MKVYFVDGELVREFDSKGERIKYNAKEAFRKTGEWAKEHEKRSCGYHDSCCNCWG